MDLVRFAVLLPLALPVAAHAQTLEYTIVIKEHRFQPAELTVASGKRIKLVIDNQDGTPEEFESHELRVEKIIPGGTKGMVSVGPLKPGIYPFFGEFHEATAQGKLHAN
ncbi:MAG TPA: cupredoxin domain-containing protein [Burkholderiales bacterium]|nr:cupredoxin domain-containing protein [Burkholderiales bacterium]